MTARRKTAKTLLRERGFERVLFVRRPNLGWLPLDVVDLDDGRVRVRSDGVAVVESLDPETGYSVTVAYGDTEECRGENALIRVALGKSPVLTADHRILDVIPEDDDETYGGLDLVYASGERYFVERLDPPVEREDSYGTTRTYRARVRLAEIGEYESFSRTADDDEWVYDEKWGGAMLRIKCGTATPEPMRPDERRRRSLG